MNQTPAQNIRNKYIDGGLADAKAHGFDCMQPKYDGHWCQCVSIAGQQTYISDTGRPFHHTTFSYPDCVLIGEFMRGTQWSQDESLKGKFFIFDCWEYLNQLLDLTYRNRLRIVATLPLDQSHARVAIYPLDARDWFWNNFVENGRFEGIVYRSSVETKLQCEIIREKRVLTLEGRVVGFQPGKIGKYGHTLGALEIEIIPSGVKTTISGMTDAERDEIWTHKPEYLGRVCEFEASAVFKSGSVRHPRFVRWRTDR